MADGTRPSDFSDVRGRKNGSSTTRRRAEARSENRHISLSHWAVPSVPACSSALPTPSRWRAPAVLLGYAIGGFIAFLIMRQLGEMVVEEPVAGSFSHLCLQALG